MKTAEEFLLDIVINNRNSFDLEIDWNTTSDATKAMIEFAKMHVKAALEAASEKAECTESMEGMYEVRKRTIINAYPESNIK